jgi:arginine utilization protein RocB
LWRDTPGDGATASYSLPFAAMEAAQIEGIVNIGPYGHGAHQRGERVHMPFSFGIVPQLIDATLHELAQSLPSA